VSVIKHEVSVETITPEIAAEWLSKNTFENQRKVLGRHVKFLTETIRQGQFDTGSPIRFAVHNNTNWLVDGQHRLSAIIASGIPSIECVVIKTHCQEQQDVAELYARIDRGRGRSLVDALRGLGLTNSGVLNRTQINLLGAALTLISIDLRGHINGADYESRSPEFRAKLISEWEQEGRQFFSTTDGSPDGRLFNRREVIAIGLITFADAHEMALQFWRGAAMDDGLSATDPRKHLLRIIRTVPIASNGIGMLAHSVAVCWNAWQRGDEMKIVRVADVRAPVKLLGTRYAKRND
jgi:hypothetical protein